MAYTNIDDPSCIFSDCSLYWSGETQTVTNDGN